MDVAPRLEVRQKLSLTPEMRQRLAVLGMSALELRGRMDTELTENPTLEVEEFGLEGDDARSEESELGLSDEHAAALAEWDEDLASVEDGSDWSVPGEERAPSAIDIASNDLGFTDHLIRQIGELALTAPVARAATAVALSLDEQGYFRGDLTEIARQARTTSRQALAGLRAVQRLDPLGVGARDLRECLLIQLKEMGPRAGLAAKIVRDHIAEIAKGKTAAIARELGVSAADVADALEIIRGLNPRPANAYGPGAERQVVIPEFEVREIGGELVIIGLSDSVPTLRVSPQYASMVRSGSGDEKTLEYLRERLRSARRFVRDVERRRDTLALVAQAAVRAQSEFFLRADGELKPLRLEQVASELGLHPSTISRAVNGKYIVSPRGTVELRRLFSGGLPSGEGAIAVDAVKKRIRDLVQAEPDDSPFSDARLADLLKAQGLDISRRTVAKYREQMAVAPSWKRKRG